MCVSKPTMCGYQDTKISVEDRALSDTNPNFRHLSCGCDSVCEISGTQKTGIVLYGTSHE